jgi:voltage-gated potassium channel
VEKFEKPTVLAGIMVLFLILAGLLPWVEASAENPSITDVGDGIWYAVVTLTTVGYGDYYPKTFVGKVIGSLFVLASLGVLGLLIGQIGDAIASYREQRRLGHHGYDVRDHIVVFGYNELVEDVVVELLASGREIVIVTHDKPEIDLIHERFVDRPVYPLYSTYDDHRLLAGARIPDCFRILMSLDEDTAALVTLLELQRRYPGQRFVVSVDNKELVPTFYGAGVEHVLSTGEIAATLVASLIFEPDVAEFARDLIAASDDLEDDFDIQQYLVGEGHRFDGASWGELFEELYREHRAVAAALARARDDGSRELASLPEDDATVSAGDYVLVIMRESLEPTFTDEVFGVPPGTRSEV